MVANALCSASVRPAHIVSAAPDVGSQQIPESFPSSPKRYSASVPPLAQRGAASTTRHVGSNIHWQYRPGYTGNLLAIYAATYLVLLEDPLHSRLGGRFTV